MTIGSAMLAIRRTSDNNDTQACCLGPTLRYISIQHFYHRWYIVALPDPGVVWNLRSDVTKFYKVREHLSGSHIQEKQKLKTNK